MSENQDKLFMAEAIRLAQAAGEHGNEPFGAVLVKDGEIVAAHENGIHTNHDYTDHAEIGLIREFSAKTGITDYSDYTLYASCEPCLMCSGAIAYVKMGALVYAASNEELQEIVGRKGYNVSKIVFDHSYHQPVVRTGVLREESLQVLREFFKTHKKA